jgi:hypothetical protein
MVNFDVSELFQPRIRKACRLGGVIQDGASNDAGMQNILGGTVGDKYNGTIGTESWFRNSISAQAALQNGITTPVQRKLSSAKQTAAEVRSRKPEMQVKCIINAHSSTPPGDNSDKP